MGLESPLRHRDAVVLLPEQTTASRRRFSTSSQPRFRVFRLYLRRSQPRVITLAGDIGLADRARALSYAALSNPKALAPPATPAMLVGIELSSRTQ